MRVLVLGATGMLGHKLVQRLDDDPDGRFEVTGTVRDAQSPAAQHPVLAGRRLIDGVDIRDAAALTHLLDREQPAAVINAVGVIKQRREAHDPVESIEINSLLPHRLAALGHERSIRVIHFSTDCVFSGKSGPYRPDDVPDAADLYGRSKLLGEIGGERSLTLRSSIVGRELRGGLGLFGWFFSQRGGHARGFQRAFYTGLTTLEMAGLVARVLTGHPDLSGVWQVASEAINKYDLLGLVNKAFELGVTLEPDSEFSCDRRLDGAAFTAETGYATPSWAEMVQAMREDPTPYTD